MNAATLHAWSSQVRLPGQAVAPPGPVDLTRTYLMHHAFRRDLADFMAAVAATPPDEPVTWLHCTAMRTAEVNWDGPTRMMNVLIPAHYVTGIKPGPPFQLGRRDFQGSGSVGVFPPIHPPPDGALPLEEIEQTIVRFLDPVLN